MKRIDSSLNPLEVMIIAELLATDNIEHYTMRPGNDCVWVSYSQLETYWIFREGKLVDIQID